ncbi:MAG: hypothetical protein QF470_03150 [Methylococcales bacterium]|jgi:hypothetical protein|nr:hypothetical protein [Methylococcales bacterium]
MSFLKVAIHRGAFIGLFIVFMAGCAPSKVKRLVSPTENQIIETESAQVDESAFQSSIVSVMPRVKKGTVKRSGKAKETPVVKRDELNRILKVKNTEAINVSSVKDDSQIKLEMSEGVGLLSDKVKMPGIAATERSRNGHDESIKEASNVHLMLVGTAISVKEAVGVTLTLEGSWSQVKETLVSSSEVNNNYSVLKEATSIQLNLTGNAVAVKVAEDIRLSLEGNAVRN